MTVAIPLCYLTSPNKYFIFSLNTSLIQNISFGKTENCLWIWFGLFFTRQMSKMLEWNRVEKSRIECGGHCRDPCTSTVSDLLLNTLCKHSVAQHFEQNALPCWWRCQQSYLVSRNCGPGAWILILPVPFSYKSKTLNLILCSLCVMLATWNKINARLPVK